MSPTMTVFTSRFSRSVFFWLAVAATLGTIAGTIAFPDEAPPWEKWNGMALVLSAILWIFFITASVHHTVSEEIRMRLDRIEDELVEYHLTTRAEVKEDVRTSFDQAGLLRDVLYELDRRYPSDLSPGASAFQLNSDQSAVPRARTGEGSPPAASR